MSYFQLNILAMPVGSIGCKDGPCMASSDKFEIEVIGKGGMKDDVLLCDFNRIVMSLNSGHGAMPNGTVDAIVEAAHVVTALQTVISRNKVCLDAI